MNKQTIEQLRGAIDSTGFRAAFYSQWEPYMANGGATASGSARNHKRREVVQSLASQFPLETQCIAHYRKALADGKITMSKEGMQTLMKEHPMAYAGNSLMRSITPKKMATPKAAAKVTVPKKSKGGRPKRADVQRATERYAKCVESFGWVPGDAIAAELIDCPISTITNIRKNMETTWAFEAGGNGTLWNAALIPQPEPEPEPEPTTTLADKIVEALGKLDKKDLQALAELLD